MSVCPASRRGRRALSICSLLLLCLLAGAGCAARGRSAAVPTATSTPTLSIRPVPTFTPTAPPPPTVTPTFTPTTQVEGVYADLTAHHDGSYRLQRHGARVEATFMTTRSPLPAGANQPPQVLFTLPPEFRPPFPILRRVVGQPVRADGSLDPASPDPRPFRLQLDPDGRVYYLDHPEVADLGYLAYSLHLTWGTTPAANDQAVLQILRGVAALDADRDSYQVEFAAGRLTEFTKSGLLGEVPPELGQLSHLQVLNLQGTLTQGLAESIPPEIGQLQNLTHLYLWGNHLTALPPGLTQLQNLTVLGLDFNQLTALPPEIGQLLNLTTLTLWDNQLTALPPQIGQLLNLTTLRSERQPVDGPAPRNRPTPQPHNFESVG